MTTPGKRALAALAMLPLTIVGSIPQCVGFIVGVMIYCLVYGFTAGWRVTRWVYDTVDAKVG